jgi:hypothetical protein
VLLLLLRVLLVPEKTWRCLQLSLLTKLEISTAAAAAEEEEEETTCDSSYPDNCIPPPPPDLTCDDVCARNFEVVPPDPHGFDGNDNDGIGCESGSNQPDLNEPDNNSGST